MDIKLSNWMSSIDPSVRLSELLIPGTHDTMTGTCDQRYYKTQTKTLAEQLAGGVRFLDLRLTRDMEAAHREWKSGIGIGEILATIDAFFAANPLETIIIRFQNANEKKDDYPEYGKALQNVVKENIDKFYLWQEAWQWPTLGECRGKIVALECSPPKYKFNFADDVQWAVNWHENDKVHLQDEWDGPDVEFKKQAIAGNLKASADFGESLSLNHISATNGELGYPDAYAEILNPFLFELLQNQYKHSMSGVMIMDFFSEEEMMKMIECNKNKMLAQ